MRKKYSIILPILFLAFTQFASANNTISTPGITAETPVTFWRVMANAYGNDVSLEWITSSELNNAGFIIEHSYNGINFLEVGKMAGVGNSNSQETYRFIHSNLEAGTHVYRLRQIDRDGTVRYSQMVRVIVEEQSNTQTPVSIDPKHTTKKNPFTSTKGQ